MIKPGRPYLRAACLTASAAPCRGIIPDAPCSRNRAIIKMFVGPCLIAPTTGTCPHGSRRPGPLPVERLETTTVAPQRRPSRAPPTTLRYQCRHHCCGAAHEDHQDDRGGDGNTETWRSRVFVAAGCLTNTPSVVRPTPARTGPPGGVGRNPLACAAAPLLQTVSPPIAANWRLLLALPLLGSCQTTSSPAS